jgi:hypothetical protein
LDETKALGKVEQADELEEEIRALTKELSRAVGLGGRDRRAGSASERARQTVTKTIRAASQRIARSDAALGKVFARTIQIGTFCSYRPDPDRPIVWQFASTIIEQPQPLISGDKEAPVSPDYTRTSPGCWVFFRSRPRGESRSGGEKL